jgi:hypothetical protein
MPLMASHVVSASTPNRLHTTKGLAGSKFEASKPLGRSLSLNQRSISSNTQSMPPAGFRPLALGRVDEAYVCGDDTPALVEAHPSLHLATDHTRHRLAVNNVEATAKSRPQVVITVLDRVRRGRAGGGRPGRLQPLDDCRGSRPRHSGSCAVLSKQVVKRRHVV